MAYNPINVGSVANDGTGDTLRTAGQKINTQLSELYSDKVDLAADHKSRGIVPPGLLGHRSQGLKLRKALSDIQAGTRKHLKIMSIGDSLSTISWSTVNVQLMKVLEGWMQSTPIYAHSLGVLDYGNFDTAAAATATPRSYDGTLKTKTDFDAAWDGTLMSLATSQYSTFSIGGNNVYADKLYIPIITEPGAGTVKIEIAQAATPLAVGSGSWRNPTTGEITSSHTLTGSELLVDANAAFGVSMVEITLPLNQWQVKVTQTGGAGAVRVRFPMHEINTAAAFNVWRVGTASNAFVTATDNAATIEAAQIAAYDPDLIVIESDDRVADYQNFLPKLEASLAAAGLTHDPLVLLVVNPFYSNTPYGDADIIERAEYCHEFAASRLGWDVIDGMALAGGLAEATAAGWQSDGIHYSGEIAYWMTLQWAVERGYFPFQRRDVGGPASLANVLKLPNLNENGAERRITLKRAPALLLRSDEFDTSRSTWASTVTGSAALTRDNAGDITLTTGSTASSGIGAFINQNGSMMGVNQGNIRGESRGFATRIRTTSSWDAQSTAYILVRTNGVTWNSGYNGVLTGEGWGFRLTSDGTTLTVHGICWDNSALVVSSSGATMTTGGASSVRDLAVICNPTSVSVVRGDLEWFVGGVSLGTSTYGHAGVFLMPRVELTNGSTATNRNLMFTPPKFLSSLV